jgi:hypothetical protein
MKANHWALALPLAGVLFTAAAAKADVAYYVSEASAGAACGADTVVWVDLDKGRYYRKEQAEYGKNANGVFACEHAAHSKYREAKSAPESVANK